MALGGAVLAHPGPIWFQTPKGPQTLPKSCPKAVKKSIPKKIPKRTPKWSQNGPQNLFGPGCFSGSFLGSFFEPLFGDGWFIYLGVGVSMEFASDFEFGAAGDLGIEYQFNFPLSFPAGIAILYPPARINKTPPPKNIGPKNCIEKAF